jgi:hypothetical protein
MQPDLPVHIFFSVVLLALPFSALAGSDVAAANNDCTLTPPPWSYPPKISVSMHTINQSSTRMPSLRHTQVEAMNSAAVLL